jgi:Na+/proline symporter
MSSQLSPELILALIAAYFTMLITVSYFTGRNASNEGFFLAGRNSPWIVVAIGMIGTSISGVTFISIPGVVGTGGTNQAFSYMQVVMGYLLGYLVIGTVLMPLYYRMNLVSIYTYLEERFGVTAYKTGAFYFLLSRSIGSSFRLYLAAAIVHQFVTSHFGIPFIATVAITIGLIWVYTYKGGIQTIIWTDTLQTLFLLAALVLSVISISQALNLGIGDIIPTIRNSDYSQLFFFKNGFADPNNFFKQFISGALIAIAMTGLDQDLMQKNLSCRTIGDAQKNMFVFSIILIFINLLFLALGAMLYIYAAKEGVELPTKANGSINGDLVYPTLALTKMSVWTGVLFILGIIACTYASADSALTALTTSFCIDFLNFNKSKKSEKEKERIRIWTHLGFSVLTLFQIIMFRYINNESVISELFRYAGYTYGPLLGLFTFGILTKRRINDRLSIAVCIIAPLLAFFIDMWAKQMNFTISFMIIGVNGLITMLGLWIISIGKGKVNG